MLTGVSATSTFTPLELANAFCILPDSPEFPEIACEPLLLGLIVFAGSAIPMIGTEEANICWNGRAMKVPDASNHSEKGRESLIVVGIVGWALV